MCVLYLKMTVYLLCIKLVNYCFYFCVKIDTDKKCLKLIK